MANVSTPIPQNPEKSHTCCNRKFFTYTCKVWCMIIICAFLVAAAIVLMYVILTRHPIRPEDIIMALPKKSNWSPSCLQEPLRLEERFDCYPDEQNVDKTLCEARGCCYLDDDVIGYVNWTLLDRNGPPVCVYPKNYGYVSAGKAITTFSGFELPLRRLPTPSRYGDDIQVVHMKVELQTKYRLRVKIYDPNNLRYEVPEPKVPVHASPTSSEQNGRVVFLYSVTYDVHHEPFTLKVRRSNSDAVIFDTSLGAMILTNQFLELTTRLPSVNVYGFGEHPKSPFKHHFKWDSYNLFASKSKDGRSLGAHPFYLCLEEKGHAHGVLLLNSNSMEVQLHPLPAVTYRTIGGILDFYIFLGPTPENVIEQYTEAIGRPLMPPYWALGLHIGQSSYLSVADMENFIEKYKAKHIPIESLVLNQRVVNDLMSSNDNFGNFSNFVFKLNSKNQKVLLQLDTTIPKYLVSKRDSVYSGSLQKSIFVTDKWGWYPVEGQFNTTTVVYPDFGSPEAESWWTQVMKKVHSFLYFDGVELVNNEPTSSMDGSLTGCLTDDLNNPPYIPGNRKYPLYHLTLCMDALLNWKSDGMTHYDVHNLYGHASVVSTDHALNLNEQLKRKLILTDSTFIGTGHLAGHNIRGIDFTWEGLQSSVSSILKLGLYGIALSGSVECGGNEELCLRWFQCAIFYPLLQLDSFKAENLYSVGINNKEVFHSIRNALSRRYELLPYLYTLFYLSHTKGSTIVRPLFHNFPHDNETYSISSQFMWGSSLLISPILEEGIHELNFYLPKGIWYDFYQGAVMYSSGEWFTETNGLFVDSKQPAVLHIRGGHIITLQKPAETTTISRQNSMSILVALNSSSEASGSLYWDDGEAKDSLALGEYLLVDYIATWNSLTVNGQFGKKVLKSSFYKAAIEQVRIMGLSKQPKRIYIDGSYILSNKQYRWNYDTKVLDLKFILIPLGRKTEIQWYY